MREETVIALGFFDGVHLGHQALLRRTAERGAERGLTPAVFTFDRSPRAVVTGVPVPLLTTPEERAAVIRGLFPIDRVIVAPFDQRMMTMPWRGFLDMLREDYHARWLVAGHDFRFGHRNEGTPALLMDYAKEMGIGCDVIPAVTVDGRTVSSTYIRQLAEVGRQAEARRLLGHDRLRL